MTFDDGIKNDIHQLLVWTRAAHFHAVREMLQDTLSDDKARSIYQLSDGTRSVEEIRKACKASPNLVIEIQQRCTALGLMSATAEGRRTREFDLKIFGLLN